MRLGLLFSSTLLALTGCGTSIKISESAPTEFVRIKEPVMFTWGVSVPKDMKLEVKVFEGNIRAVSMGNSTIHGGGVLVVGGLPMFVPVPMTDEVHMEIGRDGCTTGRRVSYDSVIRRWVIDTEAPPGGNYKFMNPPIVCFETLAP